MEYYLVRAMEVCRLTEQQLYRLHEHEKKERLIYEVDSITGEAKEFTPRIRRCLAPFEIQACFQLPTLKEHYQIPIHEVAQSVHNQRLRNDFRAKKLIPDGGDLSVVNVDLVHAFDEAVRSDPTLDLMFRLDKGKKRLTDSIEDNQWQN